MLNILQVDNILFLKDKLRNEIKENLEKDQILNNEDAKLLKQLLEKINKEHKNSNKIIFDKTKNITSTI